MPAPEQVADCVRTRPAACRDMGAGTGTVMSDREFFSTAVPQAFADMNIKYLVPCRNTPAVTEAVGEFARGERDAVSDMHITDGGGNRVPYTAIITERRRRRKKGAPYEDADLDRFGHGPEEPPHKKYIAFATNDPGIDVGEYSGRRGIETGYRMIESARPRTRSKSPEVRAFCFVYAVLMYNARAVPQHAARGAGRAACLAVRGPADGAEGHDHVHPVPHHVRGAPAGAAAEAAAAARGVVPAAHAPPSGAPVTPVTPVTATPPRCPRSGTALRAYVRARARAAPAIRCNRLCTAAKLRLGASNQLGRPNIWVN